MKFNIPFLALMLLFSCKTSSQPVKTEVDPIFINSVAYRIAQTNINNWNAAYTKALNSYTKPQTDSVAARVAAGNWIYVKTVNGKSGTVVLTTTDIVEGTNLYWNATRKIAWTQLPTTVLYSKLQTDSAIAANKGTTGIVDLSNYYNKTESNLLFASMTALQAAQATIAKQQTYIDSVRNASANEDFYTLTDGTPIQWNCSLHPNASVVVAGTRTIKPSSDISGKYYTLFIYQNATGGFDINVPAGDKILVGSGTGTKIFLNHAANSLTVLSCVKKGTIRIWTAAPYQ